MRHYSGGLVSPKIFWDQNRTDDALLSTVEGLRNSVPTAQPTYLKCSSYVYSACPEQLAAHAVLFQSHFQSSCKTVLSSWNVREKIESNHGRKYMISRLMAKNSYTELWGPCSISLEPGTEIRKSLWARRTATNPKQIHLGYLLKITDREDQSTSHTTIYNLGGSLVWRKGHKLWSQEELSFNSSFVTVKLWDPGHVSWSKSWSLNV